jgi:hypothetical protein
MTSPPRPESFAEGLSSDWELWVLDHGLPDLPDRLEPGEAVPVAYWRGPLWAAVLELGYMEPEPEDDDGPYLDSDAGGFRWSDGDWEPSNGRGGVGWSGGVELRRPSVEPEEVVLYGTGRNPSYEGDWACGVAEGVCGDAITVIELEQDGERFSKAVDSPVGAWIVAFDAQRPAVVRLKAADAIHFEQTIV